MTSVGFRPPAPPDALLETDPVFFFRPVCFWILLSTVLALVFCLEIGKYIMFSSLPQHILYPSYACALLLQRWCRNVFQRQATLRFTSYTNAYIGYMSFRGWRYHHYHTLLHDSMNDFFCLQYLSNVSNAFHLSFICFFTTLIWTWMDLGIEEAHLRGVNDLCRFLHELLHALDEHFSPRKEKEGTKDNMKCQNFKSRLPFHIIACCCISSSVVSCYFIIFHLLSDAIWCRCARPCARRFMWAHALCQGDIVLSVFMSQTNFNHDKFWKNSSFSTHFLFTRFVGRLNVAVLLRGADGLPVRAVGGQGALSRWGPSQCPKKNIEMFFFKNNFRSQIRFQKCLISAVHARHLSPCLPRFLKESFVFHLRTNFEDNLTPADDYFQQITFCHIWYTCHNLYTFHMHVNHVFKSTFNTLNLNVFVLSSQTSRCFSSSSMRLWTWRPVARVRACQCDLLTTMVDCCE